MTSPRVLQQSNKGKGAKLVFKLGGVNNAPELIEGIPENVLAFHTIDERFSSTNVSPSSPPPCLEEFCDLFNCLNKTNDYSKCGEKYKSFAECFNKFYK